MNFDKKKSADQSIRCFIAIPPDERTKRKLSKIQAAIRSTGIRAGWPSPQNFHLTLKFLGNISEQALPAIKTILSEAISHSHCFNITFNRIGVFPKIRHPKIIWIGPDKECQELMALQQNIDSKLERSHQFAKEKKFSPHITLSRIRHRVNPEILNNALEIETGPINFSVNKVHLIKSRLCPSGAEHTSLFQISLKSSCIMQCRNKL